VIELGRQNIGVKQLEPDISPLESLFASLTGDPAHTPEESDSQGLVDFRSHRDKVHPLRPSRLNDVRSLVGKPSFLDLVRRYGSKWQS
jgi:hypothetical protein